LVNKNQVGLITHYGFQLDPSCPLWLFLPRS
jgi:hypothetical protein